MCPYRRETYSVSLQERDIQCVPTEERHTVCPYRRDIYSVSLQERDKQNCTEPQIFLLCLTALSRIRLEKPTDPQLVSKFPPFYGAQTFITAFKNTSRLSLSWETSVPSMLHPIPKTRMILFYHVRLDLPGGLSAKLKFPRSVRNTPGLPYKNNIGPHEVKIHILTFMRCISNKLNMAAKTEMKPLLQTPLHLRQ